MLKKFLYIFLSFAFFYAKPSSAQNAKNFPNPLIKPSTIEVVFSKLANSKEGLRQFGYSFFVGKVLVSPSMPVPDTYTLGPGDQLVIYVIGSTPYKQLSQNALLTVDRQGKIYIPGAGVFYVWGLSVKEAQNLISRALRTNIKLTVGRLRTFNVYVSGEVNRPGPIVATAANTVVDALRLAGGVRKTGSLRDVILRRRTAKGYKTIHIDFYDLLVKGKPVDIRLKDGDSIFVKPIGKVAAIYGEVKRPAIYEIKGNPPIRRLIDLAGGLLPSAYDYRAILERYQNGTLKIIQGSIGNKSFLDKKIKDGDLLIIRQTKLLAGNAVRILGHVAYQGVYATSKDTKLSQIFKKDMLLPDTNIYYALIKRQYPEGSAPKYIAFRPKSVLDGKQDFYLKPHDEIIFFKFGYTKVDFNKIKNVVILKGTVKYPGVYAINNGTKLSDILNSTQITTNTSLNYGEILRRNYKTLQIEKIIPFNVSAVISGKFDISLRPMDTVVLFPKYVTRPVEISGLVRNPKIIPYKKNLSLKEALAGIKFDAPIKELKALILNPKRKSGKVVYLYRLLILNDKKANIPLLPGDRVFVKKILKSEVVEKVRVIGYVKRPGIYPINDGTTLYDALKAAGGFREFAYPQGLVLLRNSIKNMQQDYLRKAVLKLKQELQKQEAGVLESDLSKEELKARKEAFERKRELIDLMQKTQVTGRLLGIHVPKNLELLKNSPSNVILEDGDRIYVPKIPQSVLVFGEVFSPGAFLYSKGLTVKDLLNKAGGLTKDADRDNIFVIRTDGSVVSNQNISSLEGYFTWQNGANRLSINVSSIMDYKLSPGDAVVVPSKIKVPTMWRPLIKDTIQIIYQSALTVYTISHL